MDTFSHMDPTLSSHVLGFDLVSPTLILIINIAHQSYIKYSRAGVPKGFPLEGHNLNSTVGHRPMCYIFTMHVIEVQSFLYSLPCLKSIISHKHINTQMNQFHYLFLYFTRNICHQPNWTLWWVSFGSRAPLWAALLQSMSPTTY